MLGAVDGSVAGIWHLTSDLASGDERDGRDGPAKLSSLAPLVYGSRC